MKITLYTYFRSSCSARLRIALALKSLPYTSLPVNLLKDEQNSPSHLAINPSGTVPALVIENPGRDDAVVITQSLAALEYLDEVSPSVKLLPDNAEERALVRTLVGIISCDVQPVTNLRILKRVAPLGMDRSQWSKDLIQEGFRAYETLVSKSAGLFSVGDRITLADVCLIPAVWGAERVGVDLDEFPTVKAIAERLEKEDAVKQGHWRTQEDTPAEFKMDI
ncbi:hypothetical protein ASPZODRAFT_134164 [Penicilliopsis zonata CBS 506.65]|uniref:Maleylacetoacetate isomerase n=1 Tax=Penicilliopsis zonata CBS 506.65 TaxID=1073090 RepID=A0A1L9SEF2_9EURO|nr:hypothetical protein ASPZODRAFT_134164 [Penicilliopsis zonata CBS 506.65]OJJ45493.1 hypothetical protein ASPZODRAFT_134164 [Penicilliopsis zonata CBS 506.65]